MARDLTHDVHSIAQPRQLAAGRRRKDLDLTILAPIAGFRYVFAIVSEIKSSVVW